MNKSKFEQPYSSKLRGVAALLGDVNQEPQSIPKSTLPLTIIVPQSKQPRTYFSPEKHKQLVNSVREKGILEPILVRPIAENKYEIVAGERRYRAALDVGLLEIPVIVKDLSDLEAKEVSLIENLLRENLNPVEETEGILQLLALNLQKTTIDIISFLHRMQNESKGKVTQNVLGSEDGQKILDIFNSLNSISWESFVSSRLPLLNLPEDILQVIREGQIEYTKALRISRIKDETTRKHILDQAIKENLSLSQIKELINAEEKASNSSLSPTSLTPQMRVADTYQKIKKSKLWQSNPQKWQKLENLLSKIDSLLESEEEQKKEDT